MDKIIFETDWVKVRQTAHGFQFAERKGVNSVAVLLIRDTANGYQALLRHQPLCLHNPEVGEPQKLFPCLVTGAIEDGETPQQCAEREAYEETGYPVSLLPLGSYIVGTQSNEVVFLFWANVSGLEPDIEQGDGSYMESASHNEWHPLEYLQECEYAACPIAYVRLMQVICPLLKLEVSSEDLEWLKQEIERTGATRGLVPADHSLQYTPIRKISTPAQFVREFGDYDPADELT